MIKELIYVVFLEKYNCVVIKGNFNNYIGVFFMFFFMNFEIEIGIVEMGVNYIGEIKLLLNIVELDFGYIINFGKVYFEGFGGIEGVIKGKIELYMYLYKNNKKVFVNGEDLK